MSLGEGDIFLVNSNAIHYTHTHETTRYCLLQIPPVHLQRIAVNWQELHFRECFPAGEEDGLRVSLREQFEEMKQLHADAQAWKPAAFAILSVSHALCALYRGGGGGGFPEP